MSKTSRWTQGMIGLGVSVCWMGACGPGPASELARELPGSWEVSAMWGGLGPDTVSFAPRDWILSFDRSGTVEEHYMGQRRVAGGYQVQRRVDIGFQREALMLDLFGDSLRLGHSQPFEVDVRGDTAILVSSWDDGFHYRLHRTAER